MDENQLQQWVLARQRLIELLEETEQALIAYPPEADDEDFRFLITKALKLKEWIETIEQLLKS